MTKTTSLGKSKIKFLLLEGVHQSAVDTIKAAGYDNIEYLTGSLPDDQLKEKIADAHFIGIRSRTQLTEEVFNCANKLVAVGCFCIGTNQVDLNAARERGIAVFNAPYSNTRSVAELVIGHAIHLLRRVPERHAAASTCMSRRAERNTPSPGEAVPSPPTGQGTLRAQMREKLATPAGAKIYSRRKAIVEPVFGQIKNRGFRQFLLRGLAKVRGEWALIATSHNLLKLHTLALRAAAAPA
jgi:hypothetical protein